MLALSMILAGCYSPHSLFASTRNYEVGRAFDPSYHGKIIRRLKNGKGGEIIWVQEGKCQYRLHLNQSQVVTGWDYVSDPKDCGIKVDWSAPW